jgi:hypothetical protein
MKFEVAGFSDMLGAMYHKTRRYIPEDLILTGNNLKYHLAG